MVSSIPQSVVEALGHYVYRLEDPRTNQPFYIGKGQGERVLQHEWAALAQAGEIPSAKLKIIKAIRDAGHSVRLVIHRHGMDDTTAFHVEAALIDAFPGLSNIVLGHNADHGPADLEDLIDRYGAPPAEISFPAIVIKIEREWDSKLTKEQLYERTRRYWTCTPANRNPPPQYAIAVARGLIREIYLIDHWLEYWAWPEDRDLSRLVGRDESWIEADGVLKRGFVGTVANEFAHLRRHSVKHLTKTGSQNPIAYLNC